MKLVVCNENLRDKVLKIINKETLFSDEDLRTIEDYLGSNNEFLYVDLTLIVNKLEKNLKNLKKKRFKLL